MLTLSISNLYSASEPKKLPNKEKQKATSSPADVYLNFRSVSSAPVSNPSGLRSALKEVLQSSRSPQETEFFQELLPQALDLMWDKKIPVSATVSMAIYESNYGRSGLAKVHKNYYGIKAFRDWTGLRAPNMPTRDSGVLTQADFRRYNTLEESTKNYGSFLSTKKHYQRAFDAGNGIDFVNYVLQAGYCPDRDYLDNIRIIMKRHKLLELERACAGTFEEQNVYEGY
jgi:flagellum-specific peptidoglycan hydrolase FlgJ